MLPEELAVKFRSKEDLYRLLSFDRKGSYLTWI